MVSMYSLDANPDDAYPDVPIITIIIIIFIIIIMMGTSG